MNNRQTARQESDESRIENAVNQDRKLKKKKKSSPIIIGRNGWRKKRKKKI